MSSSENCAGHKRAAHLQQHLLDEQVDGIALEGRPGAPPEDDAVFSENDDLVQHR